MTGRMWLVAALVAALGGGACSASDITTEPPAKTGSTQTRTDPVAPAPLLPSVGVQSSTSADGAAPRGCGGSSSAVCSGEIR